MSEDQNGNREIQKKADALRSEIGDTAFAEVVESARQKVLARRGSGVREANQTAAPVSIVPDSTVQSGEIVSPKAASQNAAEVLSAEVLEEVMAELSEGASQVDHSKLGSAYEMTNKITGL
jgi:hypothetical protein